MYLDSKLIGTIELHYQYQYQFSTSNSQKSKKQTKKIDSMDLYGCFYYVHVDVHQYVSGDVSETRHHGYENDIFS